MHSGKHNSASRSVMHYLKVLLIILMIIFLINILVSSYTISITRQQNIENISNTINLYVKETQQKLNAIDHFMIWTVKHDPLIEKIEESTDMSELPKSIWDFRSRVDDFQYSTGKEYQFFLALKKENYFFNSSPIKLSYSDYKKMKHFFWSEKITGNNNYENLYTWTSLKINNTFYLYHLLEYKNRMFISLISVEDLLKPLNEINLGKNGKIIIENEQHGFLTTSSKNKESLETNSILTTKLNFSSDITSLPFSMHVSIDHFGAFEKVMFAQFSLISATICISLILFMVIQYIKKKVFNPVIAFSKNLSVINKNNEIIDFEKSGILELEEASQHFKNLITEVKKLRIDVYEQEFEKKQIQIDFMKLQIRPHFYLNCLTTIYSMAEMNLVQEIKQMSLSTSKYFRYLFQTDQNFVRLEKELDHINDYLSIQKLVYGPVFVFESHVISEVKHALIPPLMLQTFIENTIKYAVALDDYSMISLQIEKIQNEDEDWIEITLKDNGPGFPAHVLSKLQKNVSLTNENGDHIGINNVLQRLRLLYGERFSIHFTNRANSGAEISLVIPFLIHEE
ncbi:histidine kinase [Metabacillus idriensis]|uniref:sensor histidine kinase n=1 Tax=Metabacillus idriensis TaxID=324768 RepID=UPI002813B275|nr:histidine kinase [Metabacillus idriensis]MDR0139184.1 histidine kinase [Metabacillus idriensis]